MLTPDEVRPWSHTKLTEVVGAVDLKLTINDFWVATVRTGDFASMMFSPEFRQPLFAASKAAAVVLRACGFFFRRTLVVSASFTTNRMRFCRALISPGMEPSVYTEGAIVTWTEPGTCCCCIRVVRYL